MVNSRKTDKGVGKNGCIFYSVCTDCDPEYLLPGHELAYALRLDGKGRLQPQRGLPHNEQNHQCDRSYYLFLVLFAFDVWLGGYINYRL